MLKKVWNWIVSLFEPTKIEIEKIDEYIAKQSNLAASVTVSPEKEKPAEYNLKKNEVLTGVTPDGKKYVRKLNIKSKSLDEKLKEVELPVYAKGKKLPPKAKRKFLEEARTNQFSRSPDVVDTSSSSAANAAALGAVYTATTFSDDTSTYHSSSSSSSYGCDSSYDSSSYDSGSCSSSSSD